LRAAAPRQRSPGALEVLAGTPQAERWMARGAALDRDDLVAFVLDALS
jgi:hypothetical protein